MGMTSRESRLTDGNPTEWKLMSRGSPYRLVTVPRKCFIFLFDVYWCNDSNNIFTTLGRIRDRTKSLFRGEILQEDIGLRGTLLCKLLASSAERAQNGAEKPHFANFLSTKQRIVSPASGWTISVKCEYKKVRSWKFYEQNFGIFPPGHFPRKPSFLRFLGVHLQRALQPWALGVRR